MFRLVLLKSPSIPLKKGDFYIQFPKKCFLQYSPPFVKGGWRLSDNPSNASICHSERSEESHGFRHLHLKDSSADASE